MSRAWRKLNRKVQIDQRRYYLWMIAVLIGIPVNFIFSGWGEDELACTFAHFSSTWFMWVEYKTPSPCLLLSPSPPPRLSEIHTCMRVRTYAHGEVNYCLWVVSRPGQFTWVRHCADSLQRVRLLCICMHVHVSVCVCVCTNTRAWDSGRAISGNDSRETGECHYSDLFTF